MDILKEWWGVISGFLLAAIWIGANQQRLNEIHEKQVQHRLDHQQNPLVQVKSCDERRAGCGRENKLQFDAGEDHFQRLEESLSKIETTISGNHKEVMSLIISEMKK